MDLDDRTVQSDNFDLHADNLQMLQLGKHTIQHTALCPSIHPRIDGVPVAERLGQTAPCAPVLGDAQNGVEHLPIVARHVAAGCR